MGFAPVGGAMAWSEFGERRAHTGAVAVATRSFVPTNFVPANMVIPNRQHKLTGSVSVAAQSVVPAIPLPIKKRHRLSPTNDAPDETPDLPTSDTGHLLDGCLRTTQVCASGFPIANDTGHLLNGGGVNTTDTDVLDSGFPSTDIKSFLQDVQKEPLVLQNSVAAQQFTAAAPSKDFFWEMESRYGSLLVGIIVTNVNSVIVYANSAFCRTTGHEVRSCVGKHCGKLLQVTSFKHTFERKKIIDFVVLFSSNI